MESLIERIRSRAARVGVIGMGYVGLPLMVAAAERGFRVTGIDTNEDKVKQINAGQNYNEDVSDTQLATLVAEGGITATTDYSTIRDLDVIVICVPTPLNLNK
ncbi:MAG: NAD(P)-binding domain-containing protein, partial [Candidatus Bipolaricaulia bacterium]